MPKIVAAVGATAAAVALALPASAQAQDEPNSLLHVRAQVLQPNCGSGILGTTGTFVLGAPVTICI